jgi:hypothetical protein
MLSISVCKSICFLWLIFMANWVGYRSRSRQLISWIYNRDFLCEIETPGIFLKIFNLKITWNGDAWYLTTIIKQKLQKLPGVPINLNLDKDLIMNFLDGIIHPISRNHQAITPITSELYLDAIKVMKISFFLY